jgi:peptidoglycan/LPS O-acetylase OafA/YrhL
MSVSERTETDPRLISSAGYIPTLDGWRALAVLAVIVFHGVSPQSAGFAVASEGYRGVNVFFGISGFLICSKLLEEKVRTGTINLVGFYVRRVFRIIPPALAYLAVIGLAGVVGVLPGLPKSEWLSCLLFYRNYVALGHPNLTPSFTRYTGHYWSLSVEEHFYLFLPATVYLMGAAGARVFVPLVAAGVALWRVCDSRYLLFDRLLPGTYSPERTDRTIDGLLWGAALALVLTNKSLQKWVGRNLTMSVWTVLLAAYIVVAALKPPFSMMWEGMLVPVLLYGTALHPASYVGRCLENGFVRWIGRISYSLYLWQQVFFVARFASPAVPQTFPLNALGLLACASASYYLIERPMTAMGHRLFRSPNLTPPASFSEVIDSPAACTATPLRRRLLRPRNVALGLSALAIVHFLYVITRPKQVLIGFVPDDAFYELQIARHFLATGKWSFDGRLTTTTGFHLLNVYLMSLFPRLFDSPWLAVKFWMSAGLLCSIGAIVVTTNFVARRFRPPALLLVVLLFCAPAFLSQSLTILEYPYLVLVASLYVSAVFGNPDSYSKRQMFGCALLGILGSLARSDFGGLPLMMFVACACFGIVTGVWRYLYRSTTGLAGASVGLGLVFVNNYWFGRQLLSGSVKAKALWATRIGYRLRPSIETALDTLGRTRRLSLLVTLGVAAVILLGWLHRRAANRLELKSPTLLHDDLLFMLAGSGAIALYVIVYGADGGIQPWYTASFVIPFVLALGPLFGFLESDAFAQGCAAIGIAVLCARNLPQAFQPLWPYQYSVLAMSDYLRGHPVDGQVGSWNAGILGYFLDGGIVNLDGVVNDQIYPYVLDNRLIAYLDATNVKYVADYPMLITEGATEFGYSAHELTTRLQPVYSTPKFESGDYWTNYTLYRLSSADDHSSSQKNR